ncbi:TetR/AcrR family transcriptional regulator [Microbacterium azadirachtae]|uniref:TetR/AcrR family transcriptional regulator n=1 Tax=Microbacterium azadirachtae TaxID=582680 RepID=UPI003F74C7B2
MTPTRSYRTTQERRAEIIEATVRVLAEQGFAAASFARIREVAELSSTRMISYHFVDKAALMGALVEHVVQQAAAVMVPAMEAEATWRGKLAAYLTSNLRFLAENRLAARAVIEVIRNAPRTDNDLREDTSALLLSLLLTQGQEAGEFRAFDPLVMARSIRATIDAFAMAMPSEEAATAATIDEIVALYHRATRPEGGS